MSLWRKVAALAALAAAIAAVGISGLAFQELKYRDGDPGLKYKDRTDDEWAPTTGRALVLQGVLLGLFMGGVLAISSHASVAGAVTILAAGGVIVPVCWFAFITVLQRRN